MMLAFAIGAALAVPPAPPPTPVRAGDFDLPPTASASASRDHNSPLVPVRPRNLDLQGSPAPEAEWQFAADGPIFTVGAMGGRRSGRPKLAHVALDWSF